MTYKKFLLLQFIFLALSCFASCSGGFEQTRFVSIFSFNEGRGNSSRSVSGSENTANSNMPKLEHFDLLAGNELNLELRGLVKGIKAHVLVLPNMEKKACTVELVEEKHGSKKEKSSSAAYLCKIKPGVEFDIGEEFIIEGSVYSIGNEVLDFSIEFKAVNDRPAKLLFSEIKLGSTKNPGFIRFKVLESGNLSGLTLLMPAHKKAQSYVFPVAEVKKGEELVYHWFIPPGVDEPIDELNHKRECKLASAFDNARDFWGHFKKFTPKRSNALVLKNSLKGSMQDAVVFLNPKEAEWGNADIAELVEEIEDNSLWFPDSKPENALVLNITPSKKIVRKNLRRIKHSADDWTMIKTKRRKKKS